MKTKLLLLFILVLLILTPTQKNFTSIEKYSTKLIEVEVKGEVVNPGIIQLDSYSTIGQLLEKVELTEEADLSTINQTTVLKNHDVVTIGAKQQKISINSADLQQLISLPGIGETIGQRIIDYRQQIGPFQQLEDLKKVKGIGEKKYENIKELICL